MRNFSNAVTCECSPGNFCIFPGKVARKNSEITAERGFLKVFYRGSAAEKKTANSILGIYEHAFGVGLDWIVHVRKEVENREEVEWLLSFGTIALVWLGFVD